MKNKKCSKCLEIKSIDLYSNAKRGKFGVRGECKVCHKKHCDALSRTKEGVSSVIYKSQKYNSKLRGHREPDYTKAELREWLFSQTAFHELHNEWKLSGYKSDLKPSVDRINESMHYCFSNIRLMTWGDNKSLGYSGIKIGTSKTTALIPVKQLSMNGEPICEYPSIAIASRTTGICRTSIEACIKNKRKSAGKSMWIKLA